MSESIVKQAALAVGDGIWRAAGWAGGAFAGEFSQKRTTGQIVVDAVISMFPVAGEATAARDAIAISLRMSDDPEARENTGEWVALILCLLAVVPVFGGLLKGVGKLLMRAASSSENIATLCREIVALVRKFGVGNAEKWFVELDFGRYQGAVLDGFNELIGRLSGTTQFVVKKIGAAMPGGVESFLKKLPPKLNAMKALASRKIPDGFKELHALLELTRMHLIRGTWADVTVGAGRVRVMTQEARLAELAVDSGRSMGHLPAAEVMFTPKVGWPDLRAKPAAVSTSGHSWPTNTFSVKSPIVPVTRKPGEAMVRVVDTTKLGNPYTIPGRFWTPDLPSSGVPWRLRCAVLHDWSKNGSYAEVKIPTAQEMRELSIFVPEDWDGMRLWKGRIAEQLDNVGTEATGRLFPGGETQFYVDFENQYNKPVFEWIRRKIFALPTNWTDATIPNDKHIQAVLLAEREYSAKVRQEGYALRIGAASGKQIDGESTQ